jgi:general secretion pathway protein G
MNALYNASFRSTRLSSRARKGFTLVEILIVVIILGILAAIVIPQFTNASTSARMSNMASQDQTIKSQISLYMLQHQDNPPANGVSNNGSDLFTQLTSKTDQTGAASTSTTAFGPYLPSVPSNPLTASTAVDYLSTAPTVGTTAPGTAYGWAYYAATGEFHGLNQSGVVSDDGN